MYAHMTILKMQKSVARQREETSALERIKYLYPSRYFRQYMYYDDEASRTFWLPEGYMS